MVTTDDASWLAGYLRKRVSPRPAVWVGSKMTLAQLLALHFIMNKPRLRAALSAALALPGAPAGCTVAEFTAQLHSMTGQIETDYTSRQAAYDLEPVGVHDAAVGGGTGEQIRAV